MCSIAAAWSRVLGTETSAWTRAASTFRSLVRVYTNQGNGWKQKSLHISVKASVPRTGFEPAHLAALPPEDSASTNFATWAVSKGDAKIRGNEFISTLLWQKFLPLRPSPLPASFTAFSPSTRTHSSACQPHFSHPAKSRKST